MSSENTNDAAGNLERETAEPQQVPFVFISYRSQGTDKELADELNGKLKEAGFKTFMAADSLRVGDDWPSHVGDALRRCDYFLLLLSVKSAESEMVMEEVWRVKRLRETRPDKRPRILPVRVNLPFGEELNYAIDSYLNRIQQLPWESSADTNAVFEKLCEVIKRGEFEDPSEGDAAPTICTPRRGGGPPLPVAKPEWPGGLVPGDSRYYIARPDVDDECYEHVLMPRALIRIRAPRQMGKTSLLARILDHAQKEGYATGQISFQGVSADTLCDLRSFLRHFCFEVGEDMGQPDELAERWDDSRDVIHNCQRYFTRYLLRRLKQPFVLGLDETDLLFPYPKVAVPFFGMLRSCMDSSENYELWSKFRIVMVHSTECYVTMSVNQSPFENIGRGFRLPPFDEKQMDELADRHHLEFSADARELFELVNGHPFLSRLAFYYVAREKKTFRAIIENAHTEAGVFSDHLRRHYLNLTSDADLTAAFKSVVEAQADAQFRGKGTPPATVSLESVPAFKLEGMGLVKPVNNEVAVSCELYQRYFRDRFKI